MKILRCTISLLTWLLVFVITLTATRSAFACDPLGCLLINKDQDLLALVSVTAVEGKVVTVIPQHIYQQRTFQKRASFKIDFTQGSPWSPIQPSVGAHYFVSLTCEDDLCRPKWGTWEVDRPEYRSAKLLEMVYGDDAAVQWYINGRGSDFYFANNKTYARTKEGDVELFPDVSKTLDSQPMPQDETQSIFDIVAPKAIIIVSLLLLTALHIRRQNS